MKLSEMKKGDRSTLVLICAGIEEKDAKNDSTYCVLDLRDSETKVFGKLWNTKKEQIARFDKNLIEVDLLAKEFNGTLDFEIRHYKDAPEDADINSYVRTSPHPPKKVFDTLIEQMASRSDKNSVLYPVAIKMLIDNEEKLLTWGAAKKMHHAYKGGLLWHIYRMFVMALRTSQSYRLDEELLLCAVVLHDIGKLSELETDALGNSEYTVKGQLLGHSFLGIEMIIDAFKNAGVEEEKYLPLIHCIASHHGQLDWGAITVPAVKEAAALHFIDNLDAKMTMFEDELDKLEAGEISERVFAIGGPVYNPLPRTTQS